jgi:sugar O-acyltransferase (sialic acid O-acetyltransferase NeuD family)
MSERIAVLGGGGHAAVIVATLQAMNRQVVACYDDDPAMWGKEVLGVPVSGPIDSVVGSSCSHAIIGIGDNAARKTVAERLALEWTTAVHPFSWVHPGVVIQPGTVIFAGAIVQPGAQIGAHVVLNTKASVDHHCRVGDYAHIAVAHLAGGASIGAGVFMALSSTVLPGLHVGDWSTIGAGALVTKNVDACTTVVGVPARALKK